MDDVSVPISDLRAALVKILDAIEAKYGPSVELDADYYWTLNDTAAFAMVDHPEQHVGAGQLSDDVEELRDLLQREPEEGVIIWHDLGHVIGLLRRLATLDLPR